jgi:hypothetical protein
MLIAKAELLFVRQTDGIHNHRKQLTGCRSEDQLLRTASLLIDLLEE